MRHRYSFWSVRHRHSFWTADTCIACQAEPTNYLAAIAQGLALAGFLVLLWWIVWVLGG